MGDIELTEPVPSLSPPLSGSRSPYLGASRSRTRSRAGSNPHSRSPGDVGAPARREHTLSEDDYVSRIFEYVDKPIEYALYPGENFFKLATFLSKALVPNLHQRELPTEPLSYATLYLLQAVDSASSSKTFHSEDLENEDELIRLDERWRGKAHAQGGNANQLLFLRGFPSPRWLCKIGWYYVVDPEYYRRHLDMSLFSHQQWFSSPSLPSTSNTIIQLRITMLARRTPRFPDIDVARKESQEEMAMYLQNLAGQELRGNLGDSIVRKFNLHDEQYFSLEQDISITFCKTSKGWTLIIWFDSGKDLTRGLLEGPWSKAKFELISSIRNEPNKAIHTGESARRSQQLLKRAQKFQQSRAVLNLDYERLLEDFDNLDDAFYTLTPIFKYKATAENQFLNLVDSVLQQSADKIRFSKSPADGSIHEAQYLVGLRQHQANFAYHKEILERHVRSIASNLRAIRARGGPQWPRPVISSNSSTSGTSEKVKSTLATLEEDYVWLSSRAQSLSSLCDRAMQDIHDKSTLAEALKSNNQAEQVNRLNALATFISVFYLPLSFTSGFFGMNFHTFGQGNLPLWIYPVVSVPILGVSLLVMLFLRESKFMSGWWESGSGQTKTWKRKRKTKDIDKRGRADSSGYGNGDVNLHRRWTTATTRRTTTGTNEQV